MRGVKRLAFGVAVLAAGWALAPAGVPLFDGLNYPDEPYRYVAPAAGQATKLPPTTATVTADVSGGSNAQGFEVASGEQAPQISVYVPARVLQPAAGSTSVTVAATPRAPDAQPGDGLITGNVYRINATSGGQQTSLAAGTAGTVTMRAPTGFAVEPVVEFRSGTGAAWKQLQTSKIGADNFEAPFSVLGDYAVVLPTHGKSASGGSGKTIAVTIAVVLGVIVVALVVVRGVRTIGGSEPDADPDAERDTDPDAEPE